MRTKYETHVLYLIWKFHCEIRDVFHVISTFIMKGKKIISNRLNVRSRKLHVWMHVACHAWKELKCIMFERRIFHTKDLPITRSKHEILERKPSVPFAILFPKNICNLKRRNTVVSRSHLNVLLCNHRCIQGGGGGPTFAPYKNFLKLQQ